MAAAAGALLRLGRGGATTLFRRGVLQQPFRGLSSDSTDSGSDSGSDGGCASHTLRRVAVEGNIAAGKSTLLRVVEHKVANAAVVQEPLADWTKVPSSEPHTAPTEHNNLLEAFYQQPNRWAFTFQAYAFLSRLRAQHGSANFSSSHKADASLVFERSVYSDKNCFALNCYKNGLMNGLEWSVYCDWHRFLIETLDGMRLDGFVYLRASPNTCYQRLQKRGRAEESNISLDYIKSLHSRHEEWLLGQEKLPILVVDCDQDFESNPTRQHDVIHAIHEFLRTGQSANV